MNTTQRSAGAPEPGWSERDSVLYETCRYVAALVAGQAPVPRAPIATTFVPQGGPGDTLLAQGPYEMLEFRAVGDGSYVHDSSFFFATGAVGLAATAGMALVRAAGNSNRRAAANAAAQPRWVVEESGVFTVGLFGFHLHNNDGIYYWAWESITAMTITHPGYFEMYGDSTRGPVHWTFASPWAELIFALWALRRHPQHPQLINGAWLPPGWLDWVRSRGYHEPIPSPVIQIDRWVRWRAGV